MFFYLFLLLQNSLAFGFIKNTSFLNPLSKNEEKKCIERLLAGDQDARDTLIEHNLRLVAHIAKKYESPTLLLEDLISIGTVGLIKAIDSYKANHQTKLATYASKCIENEILMFLRHNKKTRLDVSINDVISKDGEDSEMTLMDVLAYDQPEIIDTIHLKDQIQILNEAMVHLTPREKEILQLRYGLNHSKTFTQKQIAKKYAISRSYVSRIEKRALTKLLKTFIEKNNPPT